MEKVLKDLKDVNKQIKALSVKVEKLLVAVDKLDKQKPVKKSPTKKTPAKKKTAKKPMSIIDTIVSVIQKSQKGVDIKTIMAKTGFSDKQIRNHIHIAKKHGKIKSKSLGVYVKA